MSEDPKKRLETSEAALGYLLDAIKSCSCGWPQGSAIENSIAFAEEALKPFYVERVATEAKAAIKAAAKFEAD